MHSRVIRRIFVITCLVTVGLLIWAGVYTRKHGFTSSWRRSLETELATKGYYINIGKLTLGAFRGLVAEDVRFFSDPERSQQIAEINDIYLDVGLERVWEKKLSIDTLDIKNGQLTIPVPALTPGEEGRELRVTKLSGRIALLDSLVEIVGFEADFGGIEISLKGYLKRKSKNDSEIGDAGIGAIHASAPYINQLKKLMMLLEHFEFSKETPPTLNIEFSGDVSELSAASATASLTTGEFKKRNSSYRISSLEGRAEYDGQIQQLKIPKIQLRDQSGQVDLNGAWLKATNKLSFELTSNAELRKLLELFVPQQELGEVVFFSPPRLSASGELDLSLLGQRDGEKVYFPGQVIGDFETDRFVTSGVIFNSGRADFSFRESHFYLRNLRVDHKTGVAFLNCKFEPGNGPHSFRFESGIQMDPRVFSPFLREKGTRRFLSKWSFSDNSGVYLAASGESTSLDFGDIRAEGVIDLRDFKLNDTSFQELEAKFEIDGAQRWYHNVALTREDGAINALLVYNDSSSKYWEIKQAVSTVDPALGFGAFNPKLRDFFTPYRFSSAPLLRIQGSVDARPRTQISESERTTDLQIDFTSKGNGYYQLLGKEVTLRAPSGVLRLKSDRVHLHSVKAGLGGGRINLEFDGPQSSANNDRFAAKLNWQDVNLKQLGQIFQFPNQALGNTNGSLQLSGDDLTIGSINGQGQASVADRDVFVIPQLTALDGLVSKIEYQHQNRTQISKARSSASFKIENGVLLSRDLVITPGSSHLQGSAKIDFPNNTFEAEISPAAKDTQRVYKASGAIRKPKWQLINGRRDVKLSYR